MLNSWLVLLPPCIVLICAFVTHRLNVSLLLGILTGSLIATNFSLSDTAMLTLKHFWSVISDPENLYLYGFLLLISIIIVLIDITGGATAFAKLLTQHLRSKKMAETSTLLFSLTLFIDDYLSGLTVGYVMRPITDHFNIARAKLAFLVQAMTSPLVILAPISSWAAAITSALEQSGVSANDASGVKIIGDPLFMYMASIPYIFYSFLIIGSTWFIVHMSISYGPMHHHQVAAHNGNLFGDKSPLPHKTENRPEHGSLLDLLFPLISLLCCVALGSLWFGDYHLFGGKNSMVEAFKSNTHVFLVLFLAGLFTLCSYTLLAFIQGKVRVTTMPSILKEGYSLIYGAILMLILAATLGALLKTDLQTGQYLANTLQGILSLSLLPCIFFIVATLTALITGSSWGTIMLLTPIAVPMLIALTHAQIPTTPEQLAHLLPVLGAIFSGAVCGNHISPIADTTIMTAMSSGAYLVDHAHTQFLYILPSIIASAIAYLIAGYVAHYAWEIKLILPLGVGMIANIIILYVFNRLFKKEQ